MAAAAGIRRIDFFALHIAEVNFLSLPLLPLSCAVVAKTIEIDGSKQQGACCKEIPPLKDEGSPTPPPLSQIAIDADAEYAARRQSASKRRNYIRIGPTRHRLCSPTADMYGGARAPSNVFLYL